MKLRVYSNPNSMVVDLVSLAPNMNRRFIGRTFDPSIGEAGAFVLTTEPQEIEDKPYYRKALRDGDLLPADDQTAKLFHLAVYTP